MKKIPSQVCIRKFVFLIVLFYVLFFAMGHAQPLPHATNGLYDLTDTPVAGKRLALTGSWRYFDRQLLAPWQCQGKKASQLYVPSVWNDILPGNGQGFGTYSIRLLLPKANDNWALFIPQLYNSYTLWINDSIAAVNGKPGTSPSETIPQWKPQVVKFATRTDTVHIVLQLANFHHHKGGIREPLLLGTASNITSYYRSSLTGTFVQVIFLTLLACGFLIYFIRKRNDRITLYYSLFCLSWAIRAMFSDLYPVTGLLPDINWTLLVRIEYLTLFLIMIFSVLFINQLFKEISNSMFKYIIITINLLFILFTLFTKPAVFTRWLSMYLTFSVLTLLYGTLLVIRALIADKTGMGFLSAGIILTIVLSGYNIIAYEGILGIGSNLLVSSIGYTLIFLCITLGLLQHLGIIKTGHERRNTLTYDDLYEKK